MRNKVSGAIAIPKASWGCAPALPNRIQVVFLKALPIATVPLEQLQDICSLLRFHKAEWSCSPRLEKRSLFSPPPPCAKRMARGFRCLWAAIRAARPHLASIFEKLLEQKTFCLPAARYLETMLLKKTVFRVRQKGVPPLLLPTSVLQLPRCLV